MPTFEDVHVWRDFPHWAEPGADVGVTLHAQNAGTEDVHVRWVEHLPPGFAGRQAELVADVPAGAAVEHGYSLRYPGAEGSALLHAVISLTRRGVAAEHRYETPVATYVRIELTDPRELPGIAERLVEVVNFHPHQGQLFAADAVRFCNESAGIGLAAAVRATITEEMGNLFPGLPISADDYRALVLQDLIGLYPLRRLELSTEPPCQTDYVPSPDFSPYSHQAKEV